MTSVVVLVLDVLIVMLLVGLVSVFLFQVSWLWVLIPLIIALILGAFWLIQVYGIGKESKSKDDKKKP